jgi:hypothetical protein
MEALMNSRLFLALLGGMMAQTLMTGAAATAPLVVAEARGIALKPGTVLDSTRPLVLKQGQHVTLISETGSTLKLSGPYNQPPASAGTSGVTLQRTLGALVTQREARAGEFGVTRGTLLADLPEPWVLDATHSGAGCLLENSTPTFWRPDSKAAASLAVAPVDHSWKAQARWPSGQDRLTITTEVPMRGGKTYIVTFNGTESAITTLLVPASLTNDDMRAAWMANRRCEQQAQALLKPVK